MKDTVKHETSVRALLFRLLLLLYICTVAYLCFANMKNLPHVPRSFFGIPTDKIVHFCMFFPFPIFGFLACDDYSRSFLHTIGTVLNITSFGCIFAGLTEIIQGQIIYRSQDIHDFAADCLAIGISASIVLIWRIISITRKKKKAK